MNGWKDEEVDFLIKHYPTKGLEWCANKLNRSKSSIRQKTSRLCLKQDRSSDFFNNWQQRAAKSKVGKKRPEQAAVIKNLHAEGKLKITQEMKDNLSRLTIERHKINGHPKGMLGKKHTEENKRNQSEKAKKMWISFSDEKKTTMKFKIIAKRFKNGTYANERKNVSWKGAWREIGEKNKYFRSAWEANYARYLEWLKINKQIKEWEHESDIFWFDGIKRGVLSYVPDFKVTNNNGSIEFHEVKGYLDARSKTKINRMRIYHPNIKLIIIYSKEYQALAKSIGKTIRGWE